MCALEALEITLLKAWEQQKAGGFRGSTLKTNKSINQVDKKMPLISPDF